MSTTTQPLLALTAADLMNRSVITVSQETSLRAVASLLSENEISGVPVVDAGGRCIGVLSATDLVRWSESKPRTSLSCVWQELADSSREAVTSCMTRDPVMVSPGTPISKLARSMLDAHIHRVIVVDERERPVGIVSSTDVLAAVAYADDDSKAGPFMNL